jgi:putative methyltransferase (TIGR04325 family)
MVKDNTMLRNLAKTTELRILCPPHLHEELQSWAQKTQALPSSTQVVSLPEPPDYVIEWAAFDGDQSSAFRHCEGYDSVTASQHAVVTQQKRQLEGPGKLTAAQLRQGQLIETIAKVLKRPLRVVDFGGAAGGHFFSLASAQVELVESWTVVETPEMVRQAQDVLCVPKLRFVDSLSAVERRPDFVLASSSLQYVDDFENYYSKLLDLDAQYFCLDRTPMWPGSKTQTYLQRVFRNDGQWQYETSYPTFIYPETMYFPKLLERYELNNQAVLKDEAMVTPEEHEKYYFIFGTRH